MLNTTQSQSTQLETLFSHNIEDGCYLLLSFQQFLRHPVERTAAERLESSQQLLSKPSKQLVMVTRLLQQELRAGFPLIDRINW